MFKHIYSTEFGDKAKIIQPTSGLQYKSIQLFLGNPPRCSHIFRGNNSASYTFFGGIMEFFYTFFGGMLENACFLSIFKILAFSLQLFSENKEHIESNIQHLRILISIVWQETGSERLYFPEKGCHLGTNRSDNET